MENIVELHAFICFFLIIISILVIWILLQTLDIFTLFPNSFSIIKLTNQFSLIDLNISLKMLSVSLAPFSGLNHRLNFGKITREQVLWDRLVDLYNVVKIYQLHFLKMYLIVKFQYLNKNYKFINNRKLEFYWTSIPCIILIIIAIPSFYYLYISEENLDTLLSVKATGYQWYWTYDYSQLFPVWLNSFIKHLKLDVDDFIIESYIEPIDYLNVEDGFSRLLEADNYLLLPINLHIKLIISSVDVLHSFAVPALGLKVDAVPGRLNQLDLFMHRSGVFYGQCSEICGIGHGFMPISLYAISYLNFLIGSIC